MKNRVTFRVDCAFVHLFEGCYGYLWNIRIICGETFPSTCQQQLRVASEATLQLLANGNGDRTDKIFTAGYSNSFFEQVIKPWISIDPRCPKCSNFRNTPINKPHPFICQAQPPFHHCFFSDLRSRSSCLA